jgi:hypothetical protein
MASWRRDCESGATGWRCGGTRIARYSHGKRRAAALGTFDIDFSAKQFAVFLYDIESESDAAELSGVRTVHLLEHVEDEGQALFGYANAGIRNLEHEIFIDPRGYTHGAAFGKFDGIVDQFSQEIP